MPAPSSPRCCSFCRPR
uniref:Amidophosphoribosyltransferase n=1 Tax=Arundo donax TaxID=35708 RepID=A0A0A9EFY1_ARUDO